jgi:hypothetical protein
MASTRMPPFAKVHRAARSNPTARGVISGSSDVGARFVRREPRAAGDPRGAAQLIPGGRRAEAARLIDISDVFVVPQLLHDDML